MLYQSLVSLKTPMEINFFEKGTLQAWHIFLSFVLDKKVKSISVSCETAGSIVTLADLDVVVVTMIIYLRYDECANIGVHSQKVYQENT